MFVDFWVNVCVYCEYLFVKLNIVMFYGVLQIFYNNDYKYYKDFVMCLFLIGLMVVGFIVCSGEVLISILMMIEL